MNNTDMFWSGFLVAYIVFAVLGMTFVIAAKSISNMKKQIKLKRDLNRIDEENK